MLDYRKVADLCSRGASTNAIAQAFRCKWETVDLAICRMQAKWGSLEKIPAELDNIGIRNELFRKSKVADGDYLQPDFSSLSKADRRKQNNELWEAYCRKAEVLGKKAYQISYFNELYAVYRNSIDVTYTQSHQPGMDAQVDWTGDKGHYMDPDTGEWVELEVFVLELPYSGYFYAEAFPSQGMEWFLKGHQHAFEHLGGVTPIVVPDNCATAVDRKTGDLNTRYTAFLDHYGALPKPTRVRSPQDKGGVERHVRIVEEEIMPKLDAMPITSLAEYNRILFSKVMARNDRPYSKRDGSRTEVFLTEEKKRLKPLPAHTYHSHAEKTASVSRDFHIQYDSAFYSVPVTFIGQRVTVRDDGYDVTIFSTDGIQIAKHRKATRKWQRRTDEVHIPSGHSSGREYSLDQFLSWASKYGPSMNGLCRDIAGSFSFAVQSFRTLNTILVRAEKCGVPEAVEDAASKCLSFGIRSAKGFSNMLSASIQGRKGEAEPEIDLNDIYCSHEEA